MGRLGTLALLLVVSCSHLPATPQAGTIGARPAVVVVGGGLAGLVTAYELEKQGISVELLEQSDRLGGKVATAHYGPGLSAEFGMQEIWSKSPLAQIARELHVELDKGGSPYSSVLLDGKVHAFSQDTDEAYFRSLFSPSELAAQKAWMRQVEELWMEAHQNGLTPRLSALQEITFAKWLEQKKLPPRVAEWVRLTLECELGATAEEFSALSGIDELRMFVFGGEQALHVKGGNSKLIEAIAAKLRGPKRLGARVTHIERHRDAQGQLLATVSYMQQNTLHRVEAQRVVVAVPWMMLHLVQMDPPLPSEAQEAITSLGRGQYAVVHLLIDKGAHALWGGAEKRPFPILTRGPLGVIYGILEPSPPEQPLEVFSLLVYGPYARAFHMSSHEAKRQEVLSELDALWKGFASHVKEVAIYPYHPAAIPYWPAGRSPFDARAKKLFEPMEGLYLAGDYLVSSHSEGAVRAAQTQAQAIARELKASSSAAK